jgi:HD-GYP domain-containing protein (c-di-GMP phosphodiesterase class II)
MTVPASESASQPGQAPAIDLNGPAFVKAVTELATRRPVTTARAIYNHQGIKLLEGGVPIDASLYDRLVAHRLATPLDEDLDSTPTVTGVVLRASAEVAMARWPFFALTAPAGRVRSMMLQAIEAIPLTRPVAFHLSLARETRPALFEHSVLMAILCAHLVREGGAPIHDMTVAATAGLLHDLGMLHIDAELLDTGNRLSGDARRPLYVHPMTSSMLIARFHEYSKDVSRAILEHHERLDGSGYPRGLVGDAISPLGRLLSLCEVVTAMFDGEREYPEQRVSLLLRISPGRFDATLVPSIHRLLRACPPVTEAVTLSAADAVGRLQPLTELLTRFHAIAAAARPRLDGAAQVVLRDVGEQADTLQRALFEAGITPDQFGLLAQSDASDPTVRAELWALSRELHWHLRASANQLRRRWRAATRGQPLPAPLAAWVADVDALDTSGP